jgi:hypothetical protein
MVYRWFKLAIGKKCLVDYFATSIECSSENIEVVSIERTMKDNDRRLPDRGKSHFPKRH